jgi:4-amino-4-deoxy-L-arabinose transferase-like glycosyltransferase
LLHALTFLLIVLNRIGYPYELHWMEGAAVDQVRWLMAGHQLYAEPSLDFTAAEYTPLYFWLGAALSLSSGAGFFSLRLLSFLASLGCAAVIYHFVRRVVSSRYWGLIAASLYLATFRIGGSAFDLARVDPLFMFFLLSAVYVLYFARGPGSMVCAGLLMTCSFLSKQTALVVAMPLALYAVLAWRGLTGWLFPLTLLTLVGFTTLVLDRVSEGWFSFYVFELPRQHEIAVEYLTRFWTADIARDLPLPAAAVLIWVAMNLRRGVDRRSLFVVALLTGMVGASWFSRMHSGGTANVLLPAFAALALCGGLAMHDLASRAEQRSRHAYALGLTVLGVGQFGLLSYSPWAQIPTHADREAGDALVEFMRTVDGEVFLPFHGHLASLAGKPPHSHLVGIDDVLRGTDDEVKTRLVQKIESALRARRFSVIILDNVNTAWFRTSVHSRWFQQSLDQSYARVGSVFAKPDVFIPVAGMRTRPDAIYRGREPCCL